MSADKRSDHGDTPCHACGCLCDDLVVRNEGGVLTPHTDCGLARRLFADSSEPIEHTVAGKPATLDDALAAASALLNKSTSPLVFGLSGVDLDGARAATRLAESLGAILDPASTPIDRAANAAMQTVGMSTATLGEVRHRSDTVVFWRADPLTTMPRFFERFIEPAGLHLPGGRSERQLWTVDSSPTPTADASDQFISVTPGEDLELVWRLRRLVGGETEALDSKSLHNQLARLAHRLRKSRYSALLLGEGLADADCTEPVVEGLFRLARELNAESRCVALVLGPSSGCEAVAWQTGFGGAVNFAAGWAEHDPIRFDGQRVLAGGGSDAVVLVGDGTAVALPSETRTGLAGLPVIVIGGPGAFRDLEPAVRVACGVPGVHSAGAMARLDGVLLPLRKLADSRLPTPAEALSALETAAARAAGPAG